MDIKQVAAQLKAKATQFVMECVVIAKVESVNYSRSRFDKSGQNWDGKAWEARKNDKDPGRPILVGKASRVLGRSVRGESSGLTVRIFSDVPYAQAHNEGSTESFVQNVGAHKRQRFRTDEVSKPSAKKAKFLKVKTGEGMVKAHQRKMKQNLPERKFIGESTTVNNKLEKLFEAHFKRVFDNR